MNRLNGFKVDTSRHQAVALELQSKVKNELCQGEEVQVSAVFDRPKGNRWKAEVVIRNPDLAVGFHWSSDRHCILLCVYDSETGFGYSEKLDLIPEDLLENIWLVSEIWSEAFHLQ